MTTGNRASSVIARFCWLYVWFSRRISIVAAHRQLASPQCAPMRKTLPDISIKINLNLLTMKILYIIIFALIFNNGFSQEARSLDDTKSYITKIINEYGYKEHSHAKRLLAVFEDDLLRVYILNNFGEKSDNGTVYNFANVYKYARPKRLPGDVVHLTIWLDYLLNESKGIWKKTDFEFDVRNYEASEQLMIAFRHLNQLLIDKKPKVEKF